MSYHHQKYNNINKDEVQLYSQKLCLYGGIFKKFGYPDKKEVNLLNAIIGYAIISLTKDKRED